MSKDLANRIIEVLDIKARAGSSNHSWIGFQNGNGTEVGRDIETLIRKAKRLLKPTKDQTLSPELLDKYGFKKVEENLFEDRAMHYFVKNAIILFFNDLNNPYNRSLYYLSYGEMRMGKYHCVSFRWISKLSQLKSAYKEFTNEELVKP